MERVQHDPSCAELDERAARLSDDAADGAIAVALRAGPARRLDADLDVFRQDDGPLREAALEARDDVADEPTRDQPVAAERKMRAVVLDRIEAHVDRRARAEQRAGLVMRQVEQSDGLHAGEDATGEPAHPSRSGVRASTMRGMSKGREIRAFDYVNQPYGPVKDALERDALAIFQRATKLAEERSETVVAALRVSLAGIEVSKDIVVTAGTPEEEKTGHSELSRVTRIPIEWHAADAPGLFPAMRAELAVYPLSFSETQVELTGRYEPPMGALGSAVDAIVGHRLAEASVHGFVRAVVERLRHELDQG